MKSNLPPIDSPNPPRVSWLEAEWLLPDRPMIRAFRPIDNDMAGEYTIARSEALNHIREWGAFKVHALFCGEVSELAILTPDGPLYLETTGKTPEPA